jgi:hypothetical protein
VGLFVAGGLWSALIGNAFSSLSPAGPPDPPA